MKSTKLAELLFSPQWVGKLLHYFISGGQQYDKTGVKLEVLYLALPFLIDVETRAKLLRANSRSTCNSLFYSENSLKLKNALSLKNLQVAQYKEITNKGVIYLGSETSLVIGHFITCDEKIDYLNENEVIREYCKAAFYLGRAFGKEDYKNVLITFGITNI